MDEYLTWMERVFQEIGRVLTFEGSFFFNMGWAASEPRTLFDVVAISERHFFLQNRIAWVKSIALGEEPCRGHLKPINSPRFLNRQWEEVYHFTKDGNRPIDRLAIGVPFADESNLERGTRGKNGNVRCRGDVWFIPYETVAEDKGHPCPFPARLPEQCIRLHGVREDLVVLDPFCGTGATGVAAQNLGVTAILIDQSASYIEIARKRCGEE